MHLNPWTMWKEQSPRQVLEIFNSYRDMNKEDDKKAKQKNYTLKSKNVKIPDWYKVPDGAMVYSADDIYQGDI